MHNKAWGRRGREWQELLYRGRSLGFEPRSQSSLRPWKTNLFSCLCKNVTLKESALLEWPGRTIRVCWSSRLRASLGSHPLAFLQLSMFILVYIKPHHDRHPRPKNQPTLHHHRQQFHRKLLQWQRRQWWQPPAQWSGTGRVWNRILMQLKMMLVGAIFLIKHKTF